MPQLMSKFNTCAGYGAITVAVRQFSVVCDSSAFTLRGWSTFIPDSRRIIRTFGWSSVLNYMERSHLSWLSKRQIT